MVLNDNFDNKFEQNYLNILTPLNLRSMHRASILVRDWMLTYEILYVLSFENVDHKMFIKWFIWHLFADSEIISAMPNLNCDSFYFPDVLAKLGVTSRGPFTLTPAWMDDYSHYHAWDEITYPFPNFNGCTVEIWEWISNLMTTQFHPTLCWSCDYLCMLVSNLIHISKRVPGVLPILVISPVDSPYKWLVKREGYLE